MRYELECGHCGYQFVVSMVELPRTMKCAVCGGVLAIARPLVIAPPAPPAPAPKPVAPPKSEPRLHVPLPAEPPKPRSRSLAKPWPAVRAGLNLARANVFVAMALAVPFWSIGAFLTPFLQDEPRGWVEKVWWWLIVAHLIPILGHLGAQFRCMTTVPESHGRELAWMSCFLIFLCGLSSAALKMPDGGFIFGGAFVPLFITAVCYWFAFLVRLGETLGDHALTEAARAYRVWLVFGLVVALALLVAALLAFHVRSVSLVRAGWTGAGLIVFFLLWKYSALLRTAVEAIDTRAPVEMDR